MDGTREQGTTWLRENVLLALLLILVSISSGLSSDDFNKCESTVKIWAESSKVNGIKEDKFTLKDLLFFLHVPRTGGRTYFYCFLSKLYTDNQECPRSYDRLHFNPSKSNCRLMVTHNDYSLMSKLPKGRTSVVTILRNPIDRIFSTYEFAVEVAARFLVHPNLTSVKQTIGRVRSKDRGTSTLDIWPWKYLVPWMREDLFTRRDARKYVKSRHAKNLDSNPYDMEDMVMTLRAFINDPIAHEIIHNGATFQVAGVTNNSNINESHKVRLCVRKHPVLGQYVLDVAKSRLLVPEDVLQEILSLNSLDVELYKHAQGIFLQQQKHLMQTNQSTSVQQHVSSQADMEGLRNNMQMDTPQNMFSLIILAFMMTVVILLIVTVKRRSSKLKV